MIVFSGRFPGAMQFVVRLRLGWVSQAMTRRPEERQEPVQHFATLACLAFPNDQDLPTLFPYERLLAFVARLVALELRSPVIFPRLGQPARLAACVVVPEAPMHEDGFATPLEDNVGTPRQPHRLVRNRGRRITGCADLPAPLRGAPCRLLALDVAQLQPVAASSAVAGKSPVPEKEGGASTSSPAASAAPAACQA